MSTPVPGQVNLVVRDLARSLEFYRLLGWDAEPTGPHAEFVFDGFRVERRAVDLGRAPAGAAAVRRVPGSRFAVVADPDGYQIGVMSPRVEEHRFWPPTEAPL